MKYNKISADVLNEADRFQRILDWQLFGMGQNAMLWGHDEDAKWMPGTPIYVRPYRYVDLDCSCRDCSRGGGHNVGNYIRPMLEVLSDLFYPDMKCEDCQVSWRGEEPCWMCGKKRPKTAGERLRESAAMQLLAYRSALDYPRVVDRVESIRRASERAAVSFQEFSMSFAAVLDETTEFAWRAMSGSPEILRPISRRESFVREPDANPFAQPDMKIEMPRPAVAEIPRNDWRDSFRTLRYVELPATFDPRGRVEPEMPQMEDLGINYDQLSYRPRWVEIMREDRRR